MTDLLSRLLDERPWLLVGPAMGSQFLGAGRKPGAAPEFWNIDQPDRVHAFHREAAEAGCDILLTNSFGANALRLKLRGAERRVRELNRAAAEIAREAADTAGRAVVVAGLVGPLGEIMAPMGSLTHALAVEIVHEQAEALKEGGADLLWLERISAAEEYRAAAEGFARAGLPWCGTMSFESAGRTMMGLTPAKMVKIVDTLPNPPLAFGADCGTGCSDLVRAVLGFAAAAPELPLIAKAGADLPGDADHQSPQGATSDPAADYAAMVRDAGARIIGACSGGTSAHLRAMRAALEQRPLGARPSLEQVVRTLGPFFSAEGDAEKTPSAKGRGRGKGGVSSFLASPAKG